MTKKIKILIVEDQTILAYGMKEVLEDMGYDVVGIANKGSKAIALFEEKQPDIILMDIEIKGDRNGIETSKDLLDIRKVPIIFITGSAADKELMQQAQIVEPYAILDKPFHKVNAENAISLALYNFNKRQTIEQEKPKEKEEPYIWLEEGKGQNVKVYYKDILWVHSQRNDLTIYVKNGKKCYKNQSLKKFKEENLYKYFIKCQKSYIVNVKYVEAFSNKDLTINDTKIPIGSTYRKDVLDLLK